MKYLVTFKKYLKMSLKSRKRRSKARKCVDLGVKAWHLPVDRSKLQYLGTMI